MIIGIYQSLIIHIIFVFHEVDSLSIEIEGNVSGILGENGTDIFCSYTKENVRTINSVNIMAFNRSSMAFEIIVAYLPGDISSLTPQGRYLKGRVTLISISQSSTKAVMIFNKLMCIDDAIYKCRVTYTDSNLIVQTKDTSSNISIQVQVTPSKPDRILWMKVSADSPSIIPTVPMFSTTSSSTTTVTTKEHETISTLDVDEQNDTTASTHSTLPRTDNHTTSSIPSDEDLSTNSRYRTTTYSIQQTTTALGIAEGDNITVVCTGDVGNPPAEYVFQKYRSGNILSMTYTATETNVSEIAENCSYYRTSSFTFQVTAKDNNASIRCVVNSSMPEFDQLYKETAPIEVNYEVRMPNITKYPNKEYYVVGKDTSIHLTCKSEGNPQPDYYWYKENSDNHKSASENLTIMVTNKTESGVYICRVSNTFNGGTFTSSAQVQVYVRNEADTSTLPSSSTGSSSGTDEKYGNPAEDLTAVYVGVSAGVVVVLLVVLGCYLFKRKRKRKDESAENNGSTNNLMHCNSKYVGESRPGAYDSIALEGDAPVISSGKKEQNSEDVRKHNEEYMKKQKNEEKIENKSPTSHQPVIYAAVNEAKKSKYHQTIETQDSSNQQKDDTYAGTQEGVYDQSGDRRHKVNENAEQFDTVGDIKKRNSTDGIESSIQSRQKGSYVNQAFNKGEKRQVATVPPISRSSGGSQGDEQTSEINAKRSQKGYENVKGTDNTHTSDAHTINQTSL